MSATLTKAQEVTILFAGDSGDGIQLTGNQFTTTNALFGNDVSTFPNFPAEIRAPQGTLAGVSGFQVHFGSIEIFTPGDMCDTLVVMNAAALKANLGKLKKGGTIIANSDGFDPKNMRLAKYADDAAPLTDGTLAGYRLISVDVTRLTRECLKDSGFGTRETDRTRNMFVLGLILWMYDRDLSATLKFIADKFAKSPAVAEANVKVLNAGYAFGETIEANATRVSVGRANMPAGEYRSIMGNQATALGLVAAAQMSGLPVFYGSYPITPASDILHDLSKYKNHGITTYQAEDEIAAIGAAIGASFGGHLGVTASSGPGIALKGEAIGLALMLEMPLVIVNVQRGGPSTGLPTKTEQADLFQAMFGRNGEAPVAVVAACTPSDCFHMVLEACRIAVEHMMPVFFLSDGYIANSAEPWRFPKAENLPAIKPRFATADDLEDGRYMPYRRNADLARKWAVPGTAGLEHRIGGIEKEDITGNISYDPANHQHMVNTRAARVEKVADHIGRQTTEEGPETGDLLILGWGSTYGAIKAAVRELRGQGHAVSHAHLRYINPMPKNLGELMHGFKHVLIPEMNTGQLSFIIRGKYLIPAIGLNKVMGIPFSKDEIRDKALEILG